MTSFSQAVTEARTFLFVPGYRQIGEHVRAWLDNGGTGVTTAMADLEVACANAEHAARASITAEGEAVGKPILARARPVLDRIERDKGTRT